MKLKSCLAMVVRDHGILYRSWDPLVLVLGGGQMGRKRASFIGFVLMVFLWDFQTNLNWTNVHAINLTLVNVTSEDNGFLLMCIAENVVGMTNASVLLTVYCK